MKSMLESLYIEKLNTEFLKNFKNVMEVPKIQKVVLSGGITSLVKGNRKNLDVLKREIYKICNQTPVFIKAKRSCDSFSIKKNDINAFKVTLRGDNMYNFLAKLMYFVLPKTKNFVGINTASIDNSGNLNFGLKDHSSFFEVDKKQLSINFGLHVNVTTNAKNASDAETVFLGLNFPLRKIEGK